MEQTTRSLCLFTSFPLHYTPWTNPKCWERYAEAAIVYGHRTRSLGDQETFQSSSGPEGPQSFACTRLGLAVRGPTWCWRLSAIWREPGTSGPRAGHMLALIPSSLSPMTVQPWKPRLLRLERCETSRLGFRDPRGI